MRASSWGDVGDYGRLVRAQEVASMHSGAGDHDEPLDPDVVVVGAGGFATGPLPPTPSGSAGALAAVAGPAPPYGSKMAAAGDRACRGPQAPPLALGSISRGSHGSSGFGPGSASAGSSPVVVGGSSRWHAPRSLMQLSSSLSSEEGGSGAGEGEGEGEGDDNASDGDSDSFFARNSEEVARPCVVMPNATAHGAFHGDRSYHGVDDDDWVYGGGAQHSSGADRGKEVYGVGEDEDEEEDEEEDDDGGSGGGQPIEVRRRQLSWAVHDVDEDEDDEDEDDEDDDEPPPLSESDDPGGAAG